MAEIVGPAAAIVALINVIGKAAFMGHSYSEKVKGASKQIKKLEEELDSLKLVLVSLQKQIEQDPDSFQTLHKLGTRLTRCEEEVQLLITKLEKPQSVWRWFFRRLKWPLDEEDTQQTIKGLDRLKNTFSFALNTDHISITRRIERNTQGIHNSGMMEQRRVVLGWIYARKFYKTHRKIKGRRYPHTGLWILKDIEFMKWFSDEDFQILWGHGDPGVGKTFLSSVVIEHIEEHPQLRASCYGLAYIYFDFKEQDQQTPILVLASLVKQLASQIPFLPAEIGDIYHRLEPMGGTPSFDDLYGMFLTAKDAFSRVYLIFDALNECVEENQRKEILLLCHRMAGDGMKLFVTSRPHTPDIQDSFKYVAKIKLEAEKEDIESYVKHKINESLTSKRFASRVRNGVISDLVRCSRRIFLLAKFNVEYICQQTSTENILRAVELVRGSWSKSRPLNAAYERFMKRVQGLKQIRTDVALKVLMLIVTARRPLTLIELQDEVFADHRLRKIRVLDERTLLDICANLVFIDDHTSRKHVRLIHYSAQEYLLKYPLLNIESSNIAPSNVNSTSIASHNTGISDIAPPRTITLPSQAYRTFRPSVQEHYNNSEIDSDLETEITHDSGIDIPYSPMFSFPHANINTDLVREDDEITVTTDVVYNRMKECEEAKNRADKNLKKHREHLHRKLTKKLENAELPGGVDSTDAHSHLKWQEREARENTQQERNRRRREIEHERNQLEARENAQREREQQKAREKERQAREAKEKERQEREQKKERQERDRKIREREQQERDRLARKKERQAREREEKEKERQEREREENERQEQERIAIKRQRRERERLEREEREQEAREEEFELREWEQKARVNIRLVRGLEERERVRRVKLEQEEKAKNSVKRAKKIRKKRYLED